MIRESRSMNTLERPERFKRSYTLRPNQNIFLRVNIPMDETKPVSMFGMETLSSIKSRFPKLS